MKYLKTKIQQLKNYLVRKLMTKDVIAIKLNKIKVRMGEKIDCVSISTHTIPASKRMFSSITIHYNGSLDSMSYDNLQTAMVDYLFVHDLFLKENADLRQVEENQLKKV